MPVHRLAAPENARVRPMSVYSPFVGAVLAGALLSSSKCYAEGADAPIVYGRLNLAAEHVEVPSGAAATASRLSNNRSVLGFRGAEDLGDGLKAIWQLEGALSLDTGTGSFTSRDTRIGLTGSWGTLFAGVWALPYTLATASLDPFYPTTAGYMALMGNGSASSSDNVIDTSAFDRRQRNVIQYWTPAWSGVSARLAYALNEETVAATGAKPSLLSGSVSADLGTWTVSAAREIHRQYQTAAGSDVGTKVGVSYSIAPWRFAGVVERLNYQTASGSLYRNAAYVSATWKVGVATTLNAGYAHAFDGRGTAAGSVGSIRSGHGTGASQLTVGGDYAFSRRTSLFAYVSRIGNASAAGYDFAINPAGVATGQKPRIVALGIRHNF